jgi:predicted restriction endonuclease
MNQILKKCLEIDKYCKGCGDELIVPHHIIYRSQGGPDELWNLISLCVECHHKAHNGFWGNTHLLEKVQRMHYSGRTFMIALLNRMIYSEDFRWQKALDKLEERK